MGKPSAKVLERRMAVLRDVARSGGVESWDRLYRHGHHYMTISACCLHGYLNRIAYRVSLTDAGRRALESDAHD